MTKVLVDTLATVSLEAVLLATGCFRVATASQTKTLPQTAAHMLKSLKEVKRATYDDAVARVRAALVSDPKIIGLSERTDLGPILTHVMEVLALSLPPADALLEIGQVPDAIADAMLARAGDPANGGSSHFEFYSGHRTLFRALVIEGVETVLAQERDLRQQLVPVLGDLLKLAHRTQTRLDRMVEAVRTVSEETEAPAKTLEAAYRAYLLKHRGEEEAQTEDLEDRLRKIAGDYALWKQLISGIPARDAQSSALRDAALASLEEGRFEAAQSKFKEAQALVNHRSSE